jgi:hypothetical protein
MAILLGFVGRSHGGIGWPVQTTPEAERRGVIYRPFVAENTATQSVDPPANKPTNTVPDCMSHFLSTGLAAITAGWACHFSTFL